MRGKVAELDVSLAPYGITPAHAGKSNLASASFISIRDHPRACGEKKQQEKKKLEKTGSPPRMRGKAAIPARQAPAARITPAHAGKSTCFLVRAFFLRDHPRACGEKLLAVGKKPLSGGSPPRMRGKVLHRSTIVQPFGITPAHAGKSRRSCI